ncbi:nucleotidyl transferase AbiEii/AbiGii toxin family protein [Thermopolyspora sp. NPDC052614]|uniref:nucleotidyl transferase AbiEii/AbiGii toxin family protein n=1 Tax=Thermopolyspora sp. NPDC052614 TaxID=3155682 RepID=UPI003416674F
MDPLQERLTRIGLAVASRHGFVLGGGHAVQLHGMGARPSEDIDLFTPSRGSPEQVEQMVVDAYRDEGFHVEVRRRTADLVQMEVSDADGHSCKGIWECSGRHTPRSCWRSARSCIQMTPWPGKWTHCSIGGLPETFWTFKRS